MLHVGSMAVAQGAPLLGKLGLPQETAEALSQ